MVVLIIALIIALIWALIELKDFLVTKKCENKRKKGACWAKRCGHYMSNAMVSLGLLMFLEVCICVFLNVSYVDMRSEDAAGFQWILSFFIVLALIGVSVALTCLLIKDGGPRVKGYYKKGTCCMSYWAVRPVSEEYQQFELDGKGSDQIWEDYVASREKDVA